MKSAVAKTILAILVVVSLSATAFLWYAHYKEDINEAWQTFRRRRASDGNATAKTEDSSSSQWISKVMEERANKSHIKEEENVLATSLAQLLITSPEDIMSYMTEENFGCKKISHSLNVFRKNFKHDLYNDNTFVLLFRALSKFHNLLCGQNKMFQQIFTPSQDEIGKLHEQFAFCAGELDWYEKNATVACAEGEKILDCYHEALVFEVGEKVAYYYDSIFKHVINASLTHACKFKKLKLSASSSGNYNLINNISLLIGLFFLSVMFSCIIQ
jgi:hypothetical protein